MKTNILKDVTKHTSHKRKKKRNLLINKGKFRSSIQKAISKISDPALKSQQYSQLKYKVPHPSTTSKAPCISTKLKRFNTKYFEIISDIYCHQASTTECQIQK